jgi:hypothetical protein
VGREEETCRQRVAGRQREADRRCWQGSRYRAAMQTKAQKQEGAEVGRQEAEASWKRQAEVGR